MDIEKRVIKVLAEYLGISEQGIHKDTLLIEELGIDSLNGLEIEIAIEKEFDINEFYEVELDKIKTVQDIITAIEKNLHA